MSKRKIVSGLALFFLINGIIPIIVFAQPIIEWEKTIGGSKGENAANIFEAHNGGYLISVFSESIDGDFDQNRGEFDVWLVKVDTIGNIEWARNYGGSDFDKLGQVLLLEDRSYLFVGASHSSDGDLPVNKGVEDGWIMKLDIDGNIIWSKTFGGSDIDAFGPTVVTSDGNFLVLGHTRSGDGDISQNRGGFDTWLIKINPEGELIWSKTYGGSGSEGGTGILRLLDGNYLIMGSTSSTNGDISDKDTNDSDAWVFEISEDGELLSSRTYGGSKTDVLIPITEKENGELVLFGFSDSDDGHIQNHYGKTDFWFAVINRFWNMQTSKKYGGSERESSSSAFLRPNGHVVMAGGSFSEDGQVSGNYGKISLRDIWLLEVDQTGKLIWEKNYGGSYPDYLPTLLEVEGGFLLLAISESSDYDVSENKGKSDVWLAKFLFPPEEEEKNCRFKVSPNPISSENINIDFEVPMVGEYEVDIYDPAGRLMYEQTISNRITAGSTLEVPSNLFSGLYFLRIEGNGHRCSEKIIMAR